LNGFGSYASANAGTNLAYTINSLAISGADAANYFFSASLTGTNGVITQAPLTVGGLSANNKVYDGTVTATYSGTPTLIGVISGDSVSVSGSPAANFAQSNAANSIAVNFDNSSLTLSNANYRIAGLSMSQTANIIPILAYVPPAYVAPAYSQSTYTFIPPVVAPPVAIVLKVNKPNAVTDKDNVTTAAPNAPVLVDAVKYIDNPNTVFSIQALMSDGAAQMSAQASITGTGFIFSLPETFAIVPPVATGAKDSITSTAYRLVAVIGDADQPLPDWIRFDVATKTFVADQVPDNIPDIKIKIIAIQADTVVGQAEIAIQIKQ